VQCRRRDAAAAAAAAAAAELTEIAGLGSEGQSLCNNITYSFNSVDTIQNEKGKNVYTHITGKLDLKT